MAIEVNTDSASAPHPAPLHQTAEESVSEQRHRRQQEILLLVLLCVGYAGYYLCRANFSVATPLIIKELASKGIMSAADAKIALGSIVAWGTLAYAGGKFISGVLSDALNGRRTFIAGMIGAVLFTVLFALGGSLPIFTLAWVGNRAVQSLGWPGLVKISSRWFRFDRYGTVMGILSLSFLFGDAASRWFMGWLIERGLTWHSVYYTAAGILGVVMLANLFLLRNAPGDVGLSEPVASPEEAMAEPEAGETAAKVTPGIADFVMPLLRSPAFWVVCIMSLGFTIIRETFNTWTPTFYHEALGMPEGSAAQLSALFPLLGGISVLIAGFASDRLGTNSRPAILFGGLLFSTGILALLGVLPFTPGAGASMAVVLVTAVALVMLGPYSYLAGAVALDFGGKRSSASAAGIIDGVGYLGGVVAGRTVAEISVTYGWHGAFLALAGAAGISALVALVYLLVQLRSSKQASPAR